MAGAKGRVSHTSDRNKGRVLIRTVHLKKSLVLTLLTSLFLGIVLHPVVKHLSPHFYSSAAQGSSYILSLPQILVDSAKANLRGKSKEASSREDLAETSSKREPLANSRSIWHRNSKKKQASSRDNLSTNSAQEQNNPASEKKEDPKIELLRF